MFIQSLIPFGPITLNFHSGLCSNANSKFPWFHIRCVPQLQREDTRYGFTGNLYKALCDRGIHTFIDDEDLQSGEEITPALQKAIEESRIAIVVLSQNYASSSFCLDELATILHCHTQGLLVIPLFYKVNPSDVRHHRGSYEEALTKHKKRFKNKKEKFQRCTIALISSS